MQPLYKSCYPLDQRCYDDYNLTEDILMEHAANGMANYIKANFEEQSSVLIVCGFGNNGADGLVLARLLFGYYKIKVYLPFGVKSIMGEVQLERLSEFPNIEFVNDVKEVDIVVDAIFGAGLSRVLSEDVRKLIVQMQMLDAYKIACDIPTGIDIDGNPLPLAFRVDTTMTMGALKECLYTDMAKDYVGEIICVDLGMHHYKYTEGFKTDIKLLEKEDLFLPSRYRPQMTHKGSFGHLAVIAGEKEGASLLSSLAALRFGVGLVTMVGEVETSLPLEVMQDTELPHNTTAIAFGMGCLAFEEESVDEVLAHQAPLVLDAGVFSSEIIVQFLEQKDREIVLTPHPKEFVSLWNMLIETPINIAILQANRFEKVREFCEFFPHVTLVLKGANMIIAQEDKLYVNAFGTSKLSKGGSGDVLSGLIGALLAQGYGSLEAGMQGTLALTLASQKYEGASYAMLPTDIIANLARLE